jgi:hypothetical protein
MVRAAGFTLAVSGERAAVSDASDRWALPRLDAAPLDSVALERELDSLLAR